MPRCRGILIYLSIYLLIGIVIEYALKGSCTPPTSTNSTSSRSLSSWTAAELSPELKALLNCDLLSFVVIFSSVAPTTSVAGLIILVAVEILSSRPPLVGIRSQPRVSRHTMAEAEAIERQTLLAVTGPVSIISKFMIAISTRISGLALLF
jgi:hypothetical protein